MNLSMKIPFLDLFLSTPENMEMEVEVPAPLRKNLSSKNLFLNQELSRRGISLPLSSEDTMIEVTFPSEWTTKTHSPSWSGKYQRNLWTTTTICPYSSTELGKKLIPTEVLPSWESMICSIRAATRYCQSFLS